MMNERIFQRAPLYKLSEIFAILSGTWMVGAAMYLTQSDAYKTLSQNSLSLLISSKSLDNPELTNALINLTNIHSQSSLNSIGFWKLQIGFAIGFVFFAIYFWFLGTIIKDKKNSR